MEAAGRIAMLDAEEDITCMPADIAQENAQDSLASNQNPRPDYLNHIQKKLADITKKYILN